MDIDLLTREEKLNPDLQVYLRDGPVGRMLHHPLLISIMVDPDRSALINRQYEARKEALDCAITEENFHRAVFLHERPYRFDALSNFITYAGIEEREDFWPLVRSVWIDSENIHESFDGWIDIWANANGDRKLAMDNDERAALEAMSDEITIYRGLPDDGTAMGLSWTLDLNKAQWFANRWRGMRGGSGRVLKGRVRKANVLAYLMSRSEEEIVVLPDDVEIMG